MTHWEELLKKARELRPVPEPEPVHPAPESVDTGLMHAPSFMENLVDRVLEQHEVVKRGN